MLASIPDRPAKLLTPASVSGISVPKQLTTFLTILTTFFSLSALSCAPGPDGSKAAPPLRMTSASGRERTRQPVTLRCDVSLVSVASTSGGGLGCEDEMDSVGGMGEPGGGGDVVSVCGLAARLSGESTACCSSAAMVNVLYGWTLLPSMLRLELR